ncbi:AAA family ATPase [Flavobacterium sp. DG2-3]|uniref:AAA family ATPase n=1 Tax=Flavobacterium sp. DG2-3 TaxID=3068317 RepID=UPI00273DE21C|nr:AAA family ATPase [Flavobacterium sp. DG2-3]MDP5201230.1 AAA family ATPase [Flavobacterium sp. DG2-3]
MNFFIVSAGEPGSDYIEDNFFDIIDTREFALHQNTQQKGTYYSIKEGDVLILKYKHSLVAYGIVVRKYVNDSKDFALRVEVQEWIMYDSANPKRGVSNYGIQNATIGGGQYGTVKTVNDEFGLKKLKEINNNNPIFEKIVKDNVSKQENRFQFNDFFELQDKLFDFLLERSYENPDFKFRTRKTNRSNRLSEGLWFLGDEERLVIGFWTGDDWRKKLPNISFIIDYEGTCRLNFSAADTDKKFDFIVNEIFPLLEINIREKDFLEAGCEYNLRFNHNNLFDCLNEFLAQYWGSIDEIIRKKGQNYFIDLIDDHIFKKDIENILYYKNYQLVKKHDDKKLYTIGSFCIENYRSIKKVELENIPTGSHWIFLTGENGIGKSNIIKALARAIGFGKIEIKESENINSFDCKISEYKSITGNDFFHRQGNIDIDHNKPLFLGFAAYGALRMNAGFRGLNKENLKRLRGKKGHSNTLFSNNAYLLDLETELSEWCNYPDNEIFVNRLYPIKEFLEGLLLNVGEVIFDISDDVVSMPLFREKDGDSNLFKPVTIEKLSSGYLSLYAMMSDLLVRLYRQQPDIIDLGELKGVVFIDEIDIHLHPKFQKHLVEQLTAAFPKVQFIATTHSPIPLLGAPKNSVICVVKRSVEKGTYLERIDDKIYFQDLLPNTILTSPIFNMDDITNENREKGRMVRTEKTFEELKFVDRLESKINEFMTNEKEEELIKLFESRRK